MVLQRRATEPRKQRRLSRVMGLLLQGMVRKNRSGM
jgi:hypothetical protein